jgi:hypothetical protein
MTSKRQDRSKINVAPGPFSQVTAQARKQLQDRPPTGQLDIANWDGDWTLAPGDEPPAETPSGCHAGDRRRFHRS